MTGALGLNDRYAPFIHEYRAFNSLVPSGAKVLAAVDRPALLGFSKYTFATLDSPGGVSPPPHMPYFKGANAKVTYLRHLGYHYIAVESSSKRGLYNFRFLLHQLHSNVYFFREQSPYYIDWQSTVNSLEESGRYKILRAGALSLIEIG